MTQTTTEIKDITFYKTYDICNEGSYILFKEKLEDGFMYTLKPIIDCPK